jgi:hypothetical protein
MARVDGESHADLRQNIGTPQRFADLDREPSGGIV